MGYFDNIGKAEYFESGKYIQPGLYLAEIQKVKQGQTRAKRPFFVVELKVLETTSAKEHPVGTDMTWYVQLDQDAALGNIKHFLSIATGIPMKDIDKTAAEDAVAEDNPLQGVKVRITAVNIKTQKDKDFTKVKFMPGTVSAADAAKEHADSQKEDTSAGAAA